MKIDIRLGLAIMIIAILVTVLLIIFVLPEPVSAAHPLPFPKECGYIPNWDNHFCTFANYVINGRLLGR